MALRRRIDSLVATRSRDTAARPRRRRSPSDVGDRSRQRVLGDVDARPELFEELVLRDDLAGLGHDEAKDFNEPRGQIDSLAVSCEKPRSGINLKRTKSDHEPW